MNKTRYFFFRHGEVDNPQKILYGRLPGFALSEKGKRQVAESAGRIKERKIDHIYSSPLLRARQTARILASQFGLKPKITRLITEARLIHQGMPLSEYKKNIQSHIYEEKYLKEGQESIDDIIERMEKFINRSYKRHKNTNIIAVSHGDPIIILKAHLTGKKFTWKFKKDNYLKTGDFIIVTCSQRGCFCE